jgi:dienelactone hydrolase
MRAIVMIYIAVGTAASAFAQQPPQTLTGTAPLEWEESDLSVRLMDGAHQFVDRAIVETAGKRARFWTRDVSSAAAYNASVQPNRERLREIIGVVDPRVPVIMEQFGDEQNPALVAETSRYRVLQVRWPVLEGLFGAGLLVQPKTAPAGRVILVPDADQTPEQLLGLAPGGPVASEAALRFAENNFLVVIPTTVSRAKLKTDDPQLRTSDQTYREWIYRQAFQMGRHVIGYEVQTVLAAVDWLRGRSDGETKIGVAGYGEGGLVAFYAAAIDPRIDAALVSGYFNAREKVWSEPIYRNVWSLVREFGDAEIASLILPRGLVIEHSPVAVIAGHKGEVPVPNGAVVRDEVARIGVPASLGRAVLVAGESDQPTGPYSERALTAFAEMVGAAGLTPRSEERPLERRQLGNSHSAERFPNRATIGFDAASRHQRFVQEMEDHVQLLVRRSDQVREQRFLLKVMPELGGGRWSTERRHPIHAAEKFVQGAAAFRKEFETEAMGRFEEPRRPFNARTRKVAETERWTAYDVVLDVYPELFAWGVLVLPKDLKPGERRPVVVCQHGRNGVPRDTVDGNKTAYNNFAGVLAERGFITFAPHNLYRGEDRYRWLDRKANTIKATLFSFILAQHDQILRWLETQPFVDASRIAFYGLSYGGETAVRVPTILEKYCLSICSGDFNQWTRKVAATDQPFSFMRTIEWEMPYWNLGHTFDYAEMAYLMVPRPFMVERGHHDRVGRDSWVAYEYAKVRWLYTQLGLAERTEIEFFQGGHSINGEGTFAFLSKHLNWPPK